jgi:hypothetical protein
MTDLIKEALTARRHNPKTRGRPAVVFEPRPKLVLLVKFALIMTALLCGLQVAHLAVLHSWNSEIFAGISGLIGTVSGVLIGRHV